MHPKNFLISLALGLAACASTPPPLSGGELAVVQMNELPPPTGYAEDAARPFFIGPLDVLIIDLFGVGELSEREIQVDAAGRVSFPMAGAIRAAGMTPPELAREIEGRLRGRYVKNPQVTVNLKEVKSQRVTVDGQVTEPGVYPVIGDMTLMQAVASANGVSELARLSEVVVFRTVGNQKMAALYDLGAIRRGVYDDPEIYPNDVVVVGDSPTRRLFRDLFQLSPALIAPVVAVLQR